MLSVILPSYNEEQMIPVASETVSRILDEAGIEHELLFVDDGSRDKTWEEIEKAAAENPRVVGLHFSRNFGKEAAMFAGLAQAGGDCCVVIDCDLQHPPEKIVEMYRLWQEGYEVVEGVKVDRGAESGMHRFAAKSFYKLISRAAGLDMADASDFKLLDRKVVDALNQMPERNVFRALPGPGADRRGEQVVRPLAGALRGEQHRLFYLRPAADHHRHGGADAPGGPGVRRGCPGAEDPGRGHRRLHNGNPAAALHRQPDHDLPGHHRLLHRPDLRGAEGPTPLYYLPSLREE